MHKRDLYTLLGVFSLSAKKSSSDIRSSGVRPASALEDSGGRRILTAPAGRVYERALRGRRKGLPSEVGARGTREESI